ncbi:ABC transporter permease [Endozoicomonas sp.]|uniref:ABC transporter permease n=1 Tax=Endozoicomonas sp. TaxID=1892382 RepID=UPI003AF61154
MVNVNWLSNTQITFQHVMKSMAYRKKNTVTMLAVLAFGFYLLFLFQNIKGQLTENIDHYSLKSDLILGKESSPLPLVLFSLFQVGSPPPAISLETLNELIKHPEIEYAIPYAYGETHRGITVIGTSPEGIKQLTQQQSNSHITQEKKQQLNTSETPSSNDSPMWAYIGANIAKQLGYKINDRITIADGNDPSIEQEYKKAFTIIDILPQKHTFQDDMVFVSLDGLIEARKSHASDYAVSWFSPDDISFISVKLRDRIALLAMEETLTKLAAEKELNITAAIPAKELDTLYNYVNKATAGLILMSFITLGLCLLTLFYALISNLQERKQEVRLYKTLGMSQGFINVMSILEPLLIITTAFWVGFILSELSSTAVSKLLIISLLN